MHRIDGRAIGNTLLDRLRALPAPKRFLAAILVGDDPASESFLAQKQKAADALGLEFRLYRLKPELSKDALRGEVGRIAAQSLCGGVIVQLPLPAHVERQYIVNVIPREKDVDVLGERALGAFYAGRNPVLPPAVGVVEEILKTQNIDLKTATVAVVGAGFLVGKPVATWLMGKAKEVSVLDEGSDLTLAQQADLVVSGVGKAGLITADLLKEDAGVIDFGYSKKEDGALAGDLDTRSLENSNGTISFYTPTPGGTGPILVAKLLENFYTLNADKVLPPKG